MPHFTSPGFDNLSKLRGYEELIRVLRMRYLVPRGSSELRRSACVSLLVVGVLTTISEDHKGELVPIEYTAVGLNGTIKPLLKKRFG
jgi:hypothetical protein